MHLLFLLDWFYGISTIVGYLMPNPVYRYISDTYDLYTLSQQKLNSSKYCYASVTI